MILGWIVQGVGVTVGGAVGGPVGAVIGGAIGKVARTAIDGAGSDTSGPDSNASDSSGDERTIGSDVFDQMFGNGT